MKPFLRLRESRRPGGSAGQMRSPWWVTRLDRMDQQNASAALSWRPFIYQLAPAPRAQHTLPLSYVRESIIKSNRRVSNSHILH